jgi:hypothetical protein
MQKKSQKKTENYSQKAIKDRILITFSLATVLEKGAC